MKLDSAPPSYSRIREFLLVEVSHSPSLRSRRLEVVGERENGRARPFFAPATQATIPRFDLNICKQTSPQT